MSNPSTDVGLLVPAILLLLSIVYQPFVVLHFYSKVASLVLSALRSFPDNHDVRLQFKTYCNFCFYLLSHSQQNLNYSLIIVCFLLLAFEELPINSGNSSTP